MSKAPLPGRGAQRGGALRLLGLLVAAAVFAALCGLGVWQVQRLSWKTALIARVEAGLTAPASPPPAQVAPADEYRKLLLEGQYLPGKDVQVQAVTAEGAGVWLMTPFLTARGMVLVNRGFVPSARKAEAFPPPAGYQRIVGLLRLDQPGGAFLRSNDPAAGRWYSRDTAAIAEAEGLGPVAPWFLDLGLPQEWRPGSPPPVTGLTVVNFRNSHLGYAVTWFALALVWAATVWFALRPKSD